MDSVSIVIGTGWTLCSLLIMCLAIPLMRGRIAPNQFYGIRLSGSFQSNEAWYDINRFGGKRLFVWSLPLLLVGITCFFLRLRANTELTFALGFAPLIFVLIPAFESWRYARKIQPRKKVLVGLMVQFFHGWRRKAGVATLAMACVLMGGWIRSRTIGERLAFQTHQEQFVFLGSNCGTFSYCRVTGKITPPPIVTYSNWPAQPQVRLNVVTQQHEDSGVIQFGKAISTTSPTLVFHFLEMPYWSITIPLTLLSAYLILVPSRK